ncbi:superoxide dismutase family protein [Litorivivens sp.]
MRGHATTCTNRKYGAPTDDKHHAGDLGNLTGKEVGLQTALMSDSMALTGETSIEGKVVIIHQKADNLRSQASGDTGKRIACGVIQPLLTTDTQSDGYLSQVRIDQ